MDAPLVSPATDPETSELVDSIVAVMDLAVLPHHDHSAGETFLECKLCGEWEGHEDDCPIPMLERWLAKQSTRSS